MQLIIKYSIAFYAKCLAVDIIVFVFNFIALDFMSLKNINYEYFYIDQVNILAKLPISSLQVTFYIFFVFFSLSESI